MRKTVLTIATAFLCGSAAFAQNIDGILRSIEENNPSLEAARLELKAGEYENLSERLLDDPEVEFNYLWGGEEVGNRHDVSVSQSFDFGLLSGQRSRLANGKNELLAIEYKAARQEVLLEAEQVCIDLAYYNALCNEFERHLANADKLVSAYSRKLELGESTALELNNTQLLRNAINGKLNRMKLERSRLQNELVRLNGGQAIDFSSLGVQLAPVNSDFETFFAEASEASPAINYARQQIEVSKSQLKLDQTAWAPGLSLGYMAEITKAEPFRGVTVGVNIPLWRNASKVRQSKAAYAAAESRKSDAVQNFYYGLLSKYNEAVGLRTIAEEFRNALEKADNRTLLTKAEEQGEISIVEYITEIELYYENLMDTLEAERDYQHALAELTSSLL